MKQLRSKKALIAVIVAVIVAATAYFAPAAFFASHFFPDTSIGGIDVSMMSADEAQKLIDEASDELRIDIYENNLETGESTLLISENADVLGISQPGRTDATGLISAQDNLAWPAHMSSNDINAFIQVDEEVLAQYIDENEKLDNENRTPAENAKCIYNETTGEYLIAPEVIGTQIDKEALIATIKSSINGFETVTIDLSDQQSYIQPSVKADDPNVVESLDKLNTYAKSVIIYTIDNIEGAVTLDAKTFHSWLVLDDEGNPVFDEEQMQAYYREIGQEYDTVGTERTFTSVNGEQVTVSGGDYGWIIDEGTEIQNVKPYILEGSIIHKDITYQSTAVGPKGAEWGTTYIDLDISDQHMWYVREGEVIFEADVVTGLPTPARETTQGVWNILEMERGKVLVGDTDPSTGKPEYETPVDYWMRVTWSGIGFHDATWQPYFGGDLYQYNGSHGCINMSYGDAAALYDIAYVGLPVVIHY